MEANESTDEYDCDIAATKRQKVNPGSQGIQPTADDNSSNSSTTEGGANVAETSKLPARGRVTPRRQPKATKTRSSPRTKRTADV